jgi:hypothetical protein
MTELCQTEEGKHARSMTLHVCSVYCSGRERLKGQRCSAVVRRDVPEQEKRVVPEILDHL